MNDLQNEMRALRAFYQETGSSSHKEDMQPVLSEQADETEIAVSSQQ